MTDPLALTADMLADWRAHWGSADEVHAAYARWRALVADAGGVPFDPVAPAATYRTALAYRLLLCGWCPPGMQRPGSQVWGLSVLAYATEGRISHLIDDPVYEAFDDVHAAMLAGYALADYVEA